MDVIGPEGRLLARLMSASTLRARELNQNVANQNTPGYKRRTVEFEDMLRRALQSPRPNLDPIRPVVREDPAAPADPNGNNVTMELELNALTENRLMYEMYAAILGGRLDIVRSAIEER